MFRIAKPESFVLYDFIIYTTHVSLQLFFHFNRISPSKNDVSLSILGLQALIDGCQVGRMNAAEAMPLIMEPSSGFYTNPVLVLDFQSLYPSIMIAYNVSAVFPLL
jgi:DNA polymerase elongation subunit (family B)